MDKPLDHLSDLHVVRLADVPNSELREGMERAINLMDNIHRGLFAEVIVAQAAGGVLTDPWEAWDVDLPGGTKVEVKTSGTIQSWPQSEPSKLQWDVEPHSGWLPAPSGFVPDPVHRRRSDVYVFAIHDGIQPQNLGEWSFRVVETRDVDEMLGDQKSITVSSLDRTFDCQVLNVAQLAKRLADVDQELRRNHRNG